MKTITPLTAFENAIKPDPGVGFIAPRTIAFANTSRFEAGNLDQALTEYLTGYEDPEDLWQYLDRMVPSVSVPRRFNFKKHDKAAAFLVDADDARASGSRFKTVEVLGTEVDTKTFARGLATMVDKDEMDLPDIEKLRVRMLSQRLARNEIVRFVALLDAAATNVNLTWSTGAPDPDQDISSALDAAQKVDGLWKNTALYGRSAWQSRRTTYRNQLTAGAIASAQMAVDTLAEDLDLYDVIVADKTKQVTSSTKTRIVGPAVYLYFLWNGMDKYDPSDFKRFWSPDRGVKLAV